MTELHLIRAEISRSDTCTALGITAKASAPVLALCRKLVEAGHDPARPLLAYRSKTLCLTVSSIGWGAKHTVKDGPNGTPRLARWQDRQEPLAAAPPTHLTAEGVAV